MCEWWIYGCGHAIRTPCPRPKPTVPTVPTVISSTNASGSNISNTNTSTQSSSRRNSSTTTSSSLLSLPRISKFCNGFPLIPKETSSPCYNCILADARLKIALEKPEVDAKKHELLRNSMSGTITAGPGGRYVDGYGNNIPAEEEYEQEFGVPRGSGGRQGQGRERGATTAFSGGLGSWNGSSMFGGSGYMGGGHGAPGGQDRRNSAGDAFKVGNDTSRGSRGGGFPNSFARHYTSYNNNNNNNNNNNGHQDGWQNGHGQQRGAGLLSPNGFGTRRNAYSSQNGGHSNSYANDNGYRQQNLANDFGGIAWGHNGGGLGHGLSGGGLYLPGTNHFNTRPF